MNLLRERVATADPDPPATWLDIYDDDLEAALAVYELVNDEKPPADWQGAKVMGPPRRFGETSS